MKKSYLRVHFASGVAAIALIAGSGMMFAQNMSSMDGGEEASVTPASAPASNDFMAVIEASGDADATYRKITIPTKGVYRFQAEAGSGIKLMLDGALVIDATGPSLEGEGSPITAIQTLTAGEHAVELSGDEGLLNKVSFGPLGSEPRLLSEVSTETTAEEAAQLAAQNSAVMPSSTATASTGNGGTLPGFGTGGDLASFSIGGSSSKSSRGTSNPESGGGATQTATDTGAMGGTFRTAALDPNTMTTAQPSTSTTTSGGGGSVTPSVSGGAPTVPTINPGTPTTPGAAPTPGTPTATPTPTPTPTPAPPSVTPTTPTPETVQASPLSPPTNVEITQAVQLTSAGNVNGQVADTGSTLFGAVMNNSMFDIVNVQLSSGRTTTVDVGPITGQFAVRLFPEDFASAAAVQVTLTGASSASDEVEATPVTYTVTGMPAQDGVAQALSRLTFGPTPDLYARVRAMGFNAYVEEQLSPGTVNDAAFTAMNAGALLKATDDNTGRLLDSLMRYEIANAAFSERQLQNVMGQFWANHFHAINKDSNIATQAIDDRRFFRDNAFGNFGEMLLYSARSPLMSQYLDNDQSRAGRINENYGREILELSTVGVEAGYGPEDVIAVSRIFTGWHYERTNPNAEGVAAIYRFDFKADRHDEDDKVIPFLNMTIAGRAGAAGVQEGEELIQILANHPSTQTRTCRKMVELLVSDDAPTNLVQACAAAWGNGGDITAMLRAILLDPTFISTAEFQRNKAKTPFEYAVSTIRAFGARPDNADDEGFYNRFYDAAQNAGQDFVRFPLPTGLPEDSAAWTTSAAMIASYNQIADVAERRQEYNIDLSVDVQDAGLETAEEVASYLLAVATADQFRLEEYDALVAVLKGEDGIFEPRLQDETQAFEKAMGLIAVLPSFQLQ